MIQAVSTKYRHLLGENLGSQANAGNTGTGQHQTNYNVVRVDDPKCKQVQSLVTVLSGLWIVVVWLVVCVNPHVSADEPSEDEKLSHKLYWIYTFHSLVFYATRTAVGDKASGSSHNQIDRDHWFHWALVFIFSSYKYTIQRYQAKGTIFKRFSTICHPISRVSHAVSAILLGRLCTLAYLMFFIILLI